jgi:hypothetical protein
VLPEYMVRKVVGEQGGTRVVHQQSVKLNTPVWQSGKPLPSPVWNSKKPLAGPLVGSGGSSFDKRSGTELWGLLKPRLGMMVKLQKQWGNIHHLYEAKRESLFEDHLVPRYIRDPDSASVAVWDLIQVRTTHARTRSLFLSPSICCLLVKHTMMIYQDTKTGSGRTQGKQLKKQVGVFITHIIGLCAALRDGAGPRAGGICGGYSAGLGRLVVRPGG